MPAEVTAQLGTGKVVKIRGGVVDVHFENGSPSIQELLYAGDLALEVAALLDNNIVRCITLAPVRGLGLGTKVTATGAPISVPVGDEVLGRMLNIFGEPIDGKPSLSYLPKRSIHRAPPPLRERVVRGTVLETGIKAIDLL